MDLQDQLVILELWTGIMGSVGSSITIGQCSPAGDVGSAKLTGEIALDEYGPWDHRVL